MEGLINTKSRKRFVDQPCSASGPMEPPGWTHPLPTMSRNASRWPWQAAHRVGVIPSSSGAFSSFRVASFSTLRYPSRAARWYRSFMAAPYPSGHSGFGSIGVVEGFPWPAPEFGSFQTRAEGFSRQQGGRDRDRAGWTVTRRRAVGGSNVGEGEELKCQGTPEIECSLCCKKLWKFENSIVILLNERILKLNL